MSAVIDGIQQVNTVLSSSSVLPVEEVRNRMYNGRVNEYALKSLFKLMKVPWSYAKTVPETLRKDMVDAGINTMKIESKIEDLHVFEDANGSIQLLTPYGFSVVADTLDVLQNDGILMDVQGNPQEDAFRVVLRAGADLGNDSESPLYPQATINMCMTGLRSISGFSGLFRQICTNGLTQRVRGAEGAEFNFKPGLISEDRFKVLVGGLLGAASASAEVFKERVDRLINQPVSDPVELLTKAVDGKIIPKVLGKKAGSLVGVLPSLYDNPEVPDEIKNSWDFINVLTYTARDFTVRTRTRMETAVNDLIDKFLLN